MAKPKPGDHNRPTLRDVLAPEEDPGLPKDPSIHGGMPLKVDDDALALAAEHDRVAAGVAPFAPDDVPPATDPPPPGTPPRVDLAQRGLLDDTAEDEQ
ncbi:MAG TPA: hypothetical protein VGO94_01430 [Mycobacteriales bacterium]|jgi:hypothetical protein|nr:hypothetical protein [Cryptosporangiaceae bacterium]MDQ1678720.1 hypothetical protein [Actinomycetota bacterium]HEV7754496.1 hypothetical protein [Mycobacteriales bacterium]